ncbi:MAG TPA: cytochrome c oxidase subunit 3 [Ktedonobacterales bacterium]|nr:cytochrome c oxidase subunit 3 [Ktedonobacterales bacterium]
MDAAVTGHGHGAAHAVDDERKVRLGMLFYVLTDVILVLFLLAAYIWLRAYNTDGGWFPFKGMRLPDQGMSDWLVILIVVSAISFYAAYRGIRAGNQMVLRAGLAVAVILELITLVLQIRFMGQQQFSTGDGSFASTFIMLSGYHVYHLILGAFLGLGLLNRALQGKYTAERHLGLITIGYFWYWMALLPVVVWLMMAALPPKL